MLLSSSHGLWMSLADIFYDRVQYEYVAKAERCWNNILVTDVRVHVRILVKCCPYIGPKKQGKGSCLLLWVRLLQEPAGFAFIFGDIL